MELSTNKTNIENNPIPKKPCIRFVEAFSVKTDEGYAYCIRDPQKIASNPLVLPSGAFMLASLMDGTRTLFDIQTTFAKQVNQTVPLHLLEELVRRLDEELYLDSPHFQIQWQAIQDEFSHAPIRQAAHAGGAYEADKEKLISTLNSLFQNREKNGTKPSHQHSHLSLLISPHIDIHRGGPGFACAYHEIRKRDPSDLYVILGTGHHSTHSYMTLTRKPFQTPLGVTQTDTEFVDEFRRQVPFDVFAEEFIHRDEHSIEFQVLFLQYVLGDSWKGKIVPILCGSFHEFVQEGISPRQDEQLAQSLDTLREMIQHYDGKVTVIAGVDMSHVGKRFGQEEGAPIHELERVKKEDREVLDALQTGDAEVFYSSIEKIKDKNNVCGLTPVYMSLDIVKPKNGTVLFYDQAVEGDYESVVSFTSAAFYQ